tara:strand:+ start:1711 stop:3321 length:1611 start_codon:yes stop_codon:yes gene_type:complete
MHFKSIKITISNFIHNNFRSKFENLNNKKLIESYNKIIDYGGFKTGKYKRLLIDGSFYNLGYFYRLQLLRAAIKSENLQEYAFIWNYNKRICKYLLRKLGIKNIYDLSKVSINSLLIEAELMAKEIKSKEDIVKIKFPFGVPGTHFYDYVLKKQRKATISLDDKKMKFYIYDFLLSIKLSKDLLEKINPDIIALSHGISSQCTPIAWIATRKKIPVFILYGDYGVPRIWKMTNSKDLFFGIGHPSRKNLLNLEKNNKKILRKIGLNYLEERLSGKSIDLGGKLAFSKGKKSLDFLDQKKIKNKKIIAIYVGNWFDFPHLFGMSRFVDILEWCKATLEKAAENKEVFWIVKSHPLDEWHGGEIVLRELLPKILPENIFVLPNNYSGKAVIDKADGLVTHHGTSAIEYASFGKPVLITDKGWYHNCGFTVMPKSREHFLELLTTNWYDSVKIKDTKLKAQLFSGLYFGIPNWQKSIVLADDSDKKILRKTLPDIISRNEKLIKKEIGYLRKWLKSNEIDFHTYKMMHSNRFTTLNSKK